MAGGKNPEAPVESGGWPVGILGELGRISQDHMADVEVFYPQVQPAACGLRSGQGDQPGGGCAGLPFQKSRRNGSCSASCAEKPSAAGGGVEVLAKKGRNQWLRATTGGLRVGAEPTSLQNQRRSTHRAPNDEETSVHATTAQRPTTATFFSAFAAD